MAFEGLLIRAEEAKTGIVCVDGYEDKLLSGRFYYGSPAGEEHFKNAIQLLMLIEQAVGEMAFPDEYSEIRRFDLKCRFAKDELLEKEHKMPTNGERATVVIKILFRQNASWQGTIQWLQGHREETFRSVYEMLRLMDSALESKEIFGQREQ